MSEQIIVVKGAAFPTTHKNVAREISYNHQCVQTLEKGGHTVIRVGSAWGGFYMRHLEAAFQRLPQANLIIVDVHGNIKDRKHRMGPRHHRSSGIWAADFYKALAQYSNNRPLNVFMSSCGSGNGCYDAIELLPKNSTLVNIKKEDDLLSCSPLPQFLSSASQADKPFAEHLFLNLLSKAYPQKIIFYPQISISTTDPDRGDIWAMWDLVRSETLEHGADTFEPAFKTDVTAYLDPYFPPGVITQALHGIELYAQTAAITFNKKTKTGTPLRIRCKIDEPAFLWDATQKGLLGAMCAIAYYRQRQFIGAFQQNTCDGIETPTLDTPALDTPILDKVRLRTLDSAIKPDMLVPID